MSKLLATAAAIGLLAIAVPPTANANERSADGMRHADGMRNADSLEVSAAKRKRWRHHRHSGWRHRNYPHRYYRGPYQAYGYNPYYYRPGPSVYIGPRGFGFSWR